MLYIWWSFSPSTIAKESPSPSSPPGKIASQPSAADSSAPDHLSTPSMSTDLQRTFEEAEELASILLADPDLDDDIKEQLYAGMRALAELKLEHEARAGIDTYEESLI